jgi:hypothetical protein
MMVSPEIQQRTVKVNVVNTRNMNIMTPIERHNHLLREGKSSAEVASRTPVNTHVASIVLCALNKASSDRPRHGRSHIGRRSPITGAAVASRTYIYSYEQIESVVSALF